MGINKCVAEIVSDNFDLEVIEFESAQSNTTAKLPILKLAQENGTSVTKMSVLVTAEEKTNKKNDVKARSLLLMALPNKHQLTFSQYNDAKTIASSTESLDFFFWMNKAEIETISIDDLYNNFKIIEQSVKKSIGASSSAQNLAFMTAPSTSSTNDVNTTKLAYEVSTVSPIGNTVIPQVSTASFSDNVVYAFMVENPNGSNLLQQDLEQIHKDGLEAMDLKWDDKFKVECFKCYKIGHFVRECRAPRNKEGQFMKHGNNEDTSSKAMLAIDGVGFDWSDMATRHVQTYMALMAFSDPLEATTMIKLDLKTWVNYNYTTNKAYPNAQRNMVPRAVLMKTGLKPFNTARTVNTAHPKSIARVVNTARPKAVNTARPHSAVVNAVRVNQANAGKPQQDDTGFIDNGCSRHMTGNIAYLLDFKEFDGGYVTFGGGAHGGRISGKGTLKTDSLDFKDFVVEKVRIFLKILTKGNNMYSFDMKNIVPKESLTCLVTKATLDQSMLWHRRLGHINFKNINKLVKDNLVYICSKRRNQSRLHVMPIWKDASYSDSPSKDVGNGEPKSASDDQKQVEDGSHNESNEEDKSKDNSSPKKVNAAGQHVNIASLKVNTGHFKLNTVDLSVNTVSLNDQDSPKDMFKLGASHTLETTHVEFFSDEDEPEVDLGNITNSYTVPTTPNTRIHKDHPI
ncbi:putative ribonuclease H-like domain-containing protein, partial [Tanacetum coccineum]